MPHEPSLREDLRVLAAEDRQNFEGPPTAEQLLALKEGRLSEAEAEIIRDFLVAHPDWASIYLELTGSERGTGSDEVTEEDLDKAWQKLSRRLQVPTIGPQSAKEPKLSPVPPREVLRRLLPLAAGLLLGLGLVWSISNPTQNEYLVVPVSVEEMRSSEEALTLRPQVAGLEFRVETSSYGSGTRLEATLLDADHSTVFQEERTVGQSQTGVFFRIPRSILSDGKTYKLTVLPFESGQAHEPLTERFTVVFGADDAEAKASGCESWGDSIQETFDSELSSPLKEEQLEGFFVELEPTDCLYEQALAKTYIGTTLVGEGWLERALDAYDQAIEVLDYLEPMDSEAGLLLGVLFNNRGAVWLRLGRLEDSGDALARARILFAQHEAPKENWGRLAVLEGRRFRLLGRYDEAKEKLRTSLQIQESGLARAGLWSELARFSIEAGDWEKAELELDEAEQALEGSNPVAHANLRADRAELRMHQGRWQESLDLASEARRLLDDAEQMDLNVETFTYSIQSRAWLELGDLAKAHQASENGLDLLEFLRQEWNTRESFFAMRHQSYRQRFDLAAVRKDPQDLWTVFESYRSQGLLESTSRRVHGDEAEATPEILEHRKSFHSAMVELDRWDPSQGIEVRELRERKFRRFREELSRLETSHGRLTRNAEEVSVEDAQALLGAGTLALIFSRGTEKYHVFIFDREHFRLQTLPVAAATVEDLSRRVLEALDPRSSPETRSGLETRVKSLSRIVLAPLAESIERAERLVIIGDGSLERFPFELLRNEGEGRWLVETHDISYLPSFSVLARLRQRASTCEWPERQVLALGDPVFGSEDPRWPTSKADPRGKNEVLQMPPLPESRREAEDIVALDSLHSTSLLDTAATRKNLLDELPRHHRVHIASHAQSNPSMPELSKVALSCIDSEEHLPEVHGFGPESCDLYFADVVRLQLCAQIVTLSSCGSARGRMVLGEGVLGLPWAFLKAGASSVVASLWNVADKKTADLMVAFQRHLHQGRTPTRALRLAKREQIAAGIEARHWAPFILLGDWKNSTFSVPSSPIDRER